MKSLTFPVRMMTPIELSSLASLNARMSSFTVNGRNAFLLSGRFMVICDRNWCWRTTKCKNHGQCNPAAAALLLGIQNFAWTTTDGGKKNRATRDLGDALIDGLLVDDVDELLAGLVRRRAPFRGLRRHLAVHAPVAVPRRRRRGG